jgi:hypothetical protein
MRGDRLAVGQPILAAAAAGIGLGNVAVLQEQEPGLLGRHLRNAANRRRTSL